MTGVEAPLSVGAVVALGDSITDGYQAVPNGTPETIEGIDADGRWPDVLGRRLRDTKRPLAMLNTGIAGNRVLQNGTVGGNADVYGPAALGRLDADVLGQAGVTTVILLEGINDLLMAPNADVDELIEGYRQLIDRRHAHGLRVLQGTLTPAGGSSAMLADSEDKRQAVNTWIRDQSPADAVVDFDAVVRDPADPSRINPQFDGSDHLHFDLVTRSHSINSPIRRAPKSIDAQVDLVTPVVSGTHSPSTTARWWPSRHTPTLWSPTPLPASLRRRCSSRYGLALPPGHEESPG